MRNVITLSDMPKDLHDWLKTEAACRSRLSGKRIGICQVVAQAVREHKGRLENPSRRRGIVIPTFELFRKKIQASEFKRGCICVPKAKWFYFGTVGNTITMKDATDNSNCLVKVRSQYRLDLKDLYLIHKKVRAGDEIVFEQTDGTINIRLLGI